MGAVAQHDVEENDAHLGIRGLANKALIAQPMIDHRMGSATGEDVVPQVDEGVAARNPHVIEIVARIDGRV